VPSGGPIQIGLRESITIGYTLYMKTAVSIPDDLYERAERLARKMKLSRSGLISVALDEYIARHTGEDVTEAMNAALLEIGEQADPFVREAALQALARTEW
jgi:metal-responsive CopG/Arc/MetJ family transcriptional regulator